MSSVGVDRYTGEVRRDWPHVVQSIGNIITTLKLTRVMRRYYGSDTPNMVDAPLNDSTVLLFYSVIATALALWEPRFELTGIQIVSASASGWLMLRLAGTYYPNGHRGDFTPDTAETMTFDLEVAA